MRMVLRWVAATLVFACVLGATDSSIARADDGADKPLATFTLDEHLGLDWERELVSFPIDAGLAQAHFGTDDALTEPAAQLRDDTGAAVPFQLYRPTAGAPLRIFFKADLPALASRSWTLVEADAAQQIGDDNAEPARIKITHYDDPRAQELILDNGLVAIRTPTHDERPVTGPIKAVRLPDGQWVGTGKVQYGDDGQSPTKLQAPPATLTALGPVFVEVEQKLVDGEGDEWTTRIRLVAGEPAAHITESSTLTGKGSWSFDIGGPANAKNEGEAAGDPALKPFLPSHLVYRPSSPLKSPKVMGRREATHIEPVTADNKSAYTAHPWLNWWDLGSCAFYSVVDLPDSVAFARGGSDRTGQTSGEDDRWSVYTPSGTLVRTSLNSEAGKADAALDAIDTALEADTDRDNDERVASTRAAFEGNTTNALFIGVGRPADWLEAGRYVGRETGITVRIVGRRHVQFAAPLRQPGRHWLIGVTDVRHTIVPDSELSTARQQVLKHFDRPLDSIKDLTLAWDESRISDYPRMAMSKSQLAELRKNPPKLYDLYAGRGVVKPFMFDPENRKLAGKAHDGALSSTKALTGLFLTANGAVGGKVNSGLPGAPHHIGAYVKNATGIADGTLGTDALSIDEKRLVRARLAYTAYQMADPNYSSPQLGLVGLPNMTTTTYASLGLLASLLSDHPDAQRWFDIAQKEIQRQLREWVGPNGGWIEAPGYQTVSMEQIMYMAMAARNAGLSDMVYDEHLKKAMRYLARLSTPPDPRFYGRRHFPPVGNTYLRTTSGLFSYYATLIRENDPELAAELQWTWIAQGRQRRSSIGGDAFIHWVSDYLYRDDWLVESKPDWRTELFPAFGAVFRHGFGTDRETYMVYHQGPFHSHYDDDQGAFEMWGKGVPLSVDWGYYGAMPAWQHNKLAMGGIGYIKDFSDQPSADYLRGEQRGWQRQILLVKDTKPENATYFVLRDTLSKGSANWWFWLYTEKDPRVVSRVLRMVGQHDVDLDVYFPAGHDKRLKYLSIKEARERDAGPPKVSEDDLAMEEVDLGGDMDFALEDTDKPSNMIETELVAINAAAIGIENGSWTDTGVTRQKGVRLSIDADKPVAAVLFPVIHGQKHPTFHAGGDDRVIVIDHQWGSDVVFLGEKAFESAHDGITFKGTVGVVQRRDGKVTLTLPHGGRIAVGDHVLESDKPASKTFE